MDLLQAPLPQRVVSISPDFGAAVGADDELGAAADLGGEIGVGIGTDFFEVAVADDDGFGAGSAPRGLFLEGA